MTSIREEMYADIKNYIESNVNFKDYEDRYDLEDKLRDDLWIEDSVTGNASGSYYCNSWRAKESVLSNMEDFGDAIREFCESTAEVGRWFIDEEWETMDVTIRCYLLGEMISTVLDDMEEELETVFGEQ